MKPRSHILIMGLLSLLFGCGGSDSPYHQEKGTWYFKKNAITLAPGETLTPLTRKFAKSNRRAFFESFAVTSDVDVSTFEALSDDYAKDKNQVWYCDTYRKGQEYYTIKYYRTTSIRGADAPSFRMLTPYYARDAKRVYENGTGFTVRDIETYERIGDMHAKDKISGYYLRAEIKGSDGATFAFVDGHYSKDARHVFWSDFSTDGGAHPGTEVSVVLPGADPATFVMIKDNYAADTNQVYYDGTVISTARASFRVLDYDYAITDTQVFFRGAAIKGADVATFVVLPPSGESATAQDKRGKFNYEKRVQQ